VCPSAGCCVWPQKDCHDRAKHFPVSDSPEACQKRDGRGVQAADPRLHRFVALKFLPDDLARDGTWSRDSAYLYHDPLLNKEVGYYRFRMRDGKVEKVADFDKALVSGPGSWSGLGPGNVRLFPRDVSAQEVYPFDSQVPRVLFDHTINWKRKRPALSESSDHIQAPILETQVGAAAGQVRSFPA
jgi:hypothetical protein